jgi:hypothetical protein
MPGFNSVMRLGGFMKKQSENNWRACSDKEIDMFEDYFEEGATEIRMLGVSKRLRDCYKDYYQWRLSSDDGSVEILENEY